MKIFKNVKALLFISIVSAVLRFGGEAYAKSWAILPKLDCGIYRLEGYLERNNQGDFILVFQKNSTSPYEVIVLGGGLKNKKQRLGDFVALEAYAPSVIRNNNAPFVYFQRFLPFATDEVRNNVQIIRKESCGLFSKYVDA